MDPWIVAFAVAVVLIASTAQTVAGFGFALIAAPALITVLDVRDAVVLVTLLGWINSTLVARQAWSSVPWRTVSWMLAGALAGMPLGLAVLLLAPEDALRLGVGVSTAVMAAALIAGLRFERGGIGSELAVGMVSGVLNTSTSMNGPPVVLYMQGRGHPPDEFRGGLAVFFFSCSLITLAAFAATGVISGTAMGLSGAAMPSVLAGNWAGHRLLRRVDSELFRRIVFALLVASALSAIGTSLARLAG